MNKGRSRFVPTLSVAIETLESRVVLSGTAAAGAAEVAAQAGHRAATQTTLAVTPGRSASRSRTP